MFENVAVVLTLLALVLAMVASELWRIDAEDALQTLDAADEGLLAAISAHTQNRGLQAPAFVAPVGHDGWRSATA